MIRLLQRNKIVNGSPHVSHELDYYATDYNWSWDILLSHRFGWVHRFMLRHTLRGYLVSSRDASIDSSIM